MPKLLIFIAFLALSAQGQTLPKTIGFLGASAEPNGGVASAAADLGGAKLSGDSTYLGFVAHLSSKGVTPFQLSTKIQFHLAQRVMIFRGAHVFWTAEIGPDFASSPSVTPPATTAALNVGYSVGSGPLVSIPLGKSVYLMPHAEMVKGSLQDLTWRGGVLIGLGDK